MIVITYVETWNKFSYPWQIPFMLDSYYGICKKRIDWLGLPCNLTKGCCSLVDMFASVSYWKPINWSLFPSHVMVHIHRKVVLPQYTITFRRYDTVLNLGPCNTAAIKQFLKENRIPIGWNACNITRVKIQSLISHQIKLTCKLPRGQYWVTMHILGGSMQIPTNPLTFSWFISRIWRKERGPPRIFMATKVTNVKHRS